MALKPLLWSLMRRWMLPGTPNFNFCVFCVSNFRKVNLNLLNSICPLSPSCIITMILVHGCWNAFLNQIVGISVYLHDFDCLTFWIFLFQNFQIMVSYDTLIVLLTFFKPFWLRVVHCSSRIISQHRLQSWDFLVKMIILLVIKKTHKWTGSSGQSSIQK